MTISIPVTPKPKQRVRVVNGHAYTPKKTVQYEQIISKAVQGIKVTGAVGIWVLFEMPMPKSWSKAKKIRMNGTPHLQTPDTDNLLKAVMDGMKSVWSDDRTVYAVSGTKVWAYDPQVIITIEGSKSNESDNYKRRQDDQIDNRGV